MFAIRIKPKTKSRPKTNRGCVWVGEDLENYTTKDHAATFETRTDAEKSITERWEIVVEIFPVERHEQKTD